jgi:hypothetical protein
LIYGLGGLIIPFIGIKIIDLVVVHCMSKFKPTGFKRLPEKNNKTNENIFSILKFTLFMVVLLAVIYPMAILE